MRVELSVTAISWLPAASLDGLPELPLAQGRVNYDDSPPERIESLDALKRREAFRTANELRAWLDVLDGRIVDCGYSGRGLIGITWLSLGRREVGFSAVAFPLLQADPEVGPNWARFTQTAGGLMELPPPSGHGSSPRRRGRRCSSPCTRTVAPVTLSSEPVRFRVTGLTTRPGGWSRSLGRSTSKSGSGSRTWRRPGEAGTRRSSQRRSSPSLERELSRSLLRAGERPERRQLETGEQARPPG